MVFALALRAEVEQMRARLRALAQTLGSPELREEMLLEIERGAPEDDRRIADLLSTAIARWKN